MSTQAHRCLRACLIAILAVVVVAVSACSGSSASADSSGNTSVPRPFRNIEVPEHFVVSAVGSSLTQGWPLTALKPTITYSALLERSIKTSGFLPVGTDFTWRDHGIGGGGIEQITEQLDAVIAEDPDIVLFEPGTPNNWGRNIAPDRARELTTAALQRLRSALPEAFVLGVVPSPNRNPSQNAVGATYFDYIRGDRSALATASATCDVYAQFPSENLNRYFVDDAHLNATGQELWARTVEGCLSLPRTCGWLSSADDGGNDNVIAPVTRARDEQGSLSVVALGSSITEGYPENLVCPQGVWVNRVRDAIASRVVSSPQQTVTLQNIAKSGADAEVVSQVAALVSGDLRTANIVLLETGSPNSYKFGRDPDAVTATTRNLVRLVRQQIPDAYIVGVVSQPMLLAPPNQMSLEYEPYTEAAVTGLADVDRVCNVTGAFPGPLQNSDFVDDVHLSTDGNARFAQSMIDCLF